MERWFITKDRREKNAGNIKIDGLGRLETIATGMNVVIEMSIHFSVRNVLHINCCKNRFWICFLCSRKKVDMAREKCK